MPAAVEAVAGEDDVFAIGRKHWKCVKGLVKRNLLQACAIHIDHVQVEIAAFFALVIACKNDLVARRMPARRPVGLADVGDLLGIRAVCIRHKNLQLTRLYESFFEQVFVAFLIFWRRGARGAPYQALAVGREKCPAVIAQVTGDLLLVRSVDVHRPEFQIAAPGRGKYNFLAIWRNRSLGIVTLGIGELTVKIAFEVGDKDIVAVIDWPHIFAIHLARRGRGASVVDQVRGGIQDFLVARQKISTCRAPVAVADARHLAVVGSSDGHHEYLVTFGAPIRKITLKRELLAIKTEIRLSVVSPKSELFYVFEMFFSFVTQGILDGLDLQSVVAVSTVAIGRRIATECNQESQKEARQGELNAKILHPNIQFRRKLREKCTLSTQYDSALFMTFDQKLAVQSLAKHFAAHKAEHPMNFCHETVLGPTI
jgi:hypothetical protein